ncbi:MAG: rhodanese-like domain-containing protein [Anaerolineales bacterium]|jgi:thiosulfate/3-mercaptopyruvate sulfurtransferase
MTKITTKELHQRLGDPELLIVDLRPMAAFNGWRLRGEKRGGHIRGALACPQEWLNGLEVLDIKALLTSKGITPDKTVVVYGYKRAVSATVADMLTNLGYGRVCAYEDGLSTWAQDENLPMDRLPNYHKLVYPGWLRQLIDGGQPDTYPGGEFAIFHVNFGVPEEYAAGHIPGAMHLDTNTLESEQTWNRRSAEELDAALRAHGIHRDKMIVLYGRDSEGDTDELKPGQMAGQIAATRAAAILMYAGVEDVRLLDGGYGAWLKAGYEVEMEWREPTPVESTGLQIPTRSGFFVDTEEAKELLKDHNGMLVSIRSWPEYTGEVSGYDYIAPSGRIPGAVWGNCGTDAYHMQHYRNIDNTMRDFHEIEANWKEADITPDKRVAFYCGTGWRASETFIYAHLMGWKRVAIYDGGWFEWIQDPSNPIESGQP